MSTYITKAEAAAQLGVSVRTILRYLAEGRLTRYTGPGGRTMIDPDDLKPCHECGRSVTKL